MKLVRIGIHQLVCSRGNDTLTIPKPNERSIFSPDETAIRLCIRTVREWVTGELSLLGETDLRKLYQPGPPSLSIQSSCLQLSRKTSRIPFKFSVTRKFPQVPTWKWCLWKTILDIFLDHHSYLKRFALRKTITVSLNHTPVSFL